MATITTINSGDNISSSRADINTNFTNLNTDKIETSVIDTDTALAANSDSKLPSQKAVKAYVDAIAPFLTFYGCHVYQNAASSADAGTVQLFQVEKFDTDNMHSTSVNTGRITFNTAGKYMFGGTIYTGSATAHTAYIVLNGTTKLAVGGTGNGGTNGACASGLYQFSQGDYIEMYGESNGAQNSSGDASTNFWAYRVAT